MAITQTEHTPGPWTLRRPPEPVPHVSYWIDGPLDAPGATIGAPIADIKVHGPTEADARLIAAAPVLLAALREIAAVFWDDHEDCRYCDAPEGTPHDQDALCAKACAAIAAAEGDAS